MVPPDHASEPAPLRHAHHVDAAPDLEHRDRELLADLVRRRILHAHFAQEADHGGVPLRQVAPLRRRHPLLPARAEPDLERRVAVPLRRLDLHDRARPRREHGHGHDAPLIVEQLGHPDLASDEADHDRLPSRA
jgi:hypothetical protein